MLWNVPTLAGASRVTLDFEENMYGHRSGIQTPASGGGSIVTGPGGTAGVQLVATAYVPPGPVTIDPPPEAGV